MIGTATPSVSSDTFTLECGESFLEKLKHIRCIAAIF